MGRKKKPKKKKSPQRAALTPEQEAVVNSFLQELEGNDPREMVAKVPDSRHAHAIIERVCLEEEPSLPLLLAFKDAFDDKTVHKAIKRTLFKLKQKGLALEEFTKPQITPSLILKKPHEEKPTAYIGPVLNMFGSRAVMITHYRAMKGRFVGMGLISDEDGMHEFLYGSFSKKRTKEMKAQLSEKAGPLVETSLAHAATILENAYHRQVKMHPNAPPDYLELRPWLVENASLLERPIIYGLITDDQIANKVLTDSQLEKFFKHKLMEAWIIEFDLLQPFMEELVKAGNSPIVLSESQKTDQERRIKEKCMDELFPVSKRAILKQRLEEMAYVFFKLEGERLSRLCLDTARTLDQKENFLQKSPVIEFLVERSLNFYMKRVQDEARENEEAEDTSSSKIILP